MNYELAKKLKEVGFKFKKFEDTIYSELSSNDSEPFVFEIDNELYIYPTLEEIVKACGDIKFDLSGGYGDGWYAYKNQDYERQILGKGSTPLEAVANLYIALHEKRS